MIVEIYTDGACKGNPGPGGWGALLRFENQEKTLHGGDVLTTNNRMELMAAIQGLNALKRPCIVDLYTDSQYVRQGMTQWMINWKKNNWKTAKKEPVKNADLWQELEKAASVHTVRWHWVKGHSDHPLNDRADALANQGIIELNVAISS